MHLECNDNLFIWHAFHLDLTWIGGLGTWLKDLYRSSTRPDANFFHSQQVYLIKVNYLEHLCFFWLCLGFFVRKYCLVDVGIQTPENTLNHIYHLQDYRSRRMSWRGISVFSRFVSNFEMHDICILKWINAQMLIVVTYITLHTSYVTLHSLAHSCAHSC